MREYNLQQQGIIFVQRWFLNSVMIAVLVFLFGKVTGEYNFLTFILAGLIFSIINATIKPIVTILSLSAILLTLGLFTLVVNGFIIWLSLKLAPNVSMTFGNAILSGIVMSSLNYYIGEHNSERFKREK